MAESSSRGIQTHPAITKNQAEIVLSAVPARSNRFSERLSEIRQKIRLFSVAQFEGMLAKQPLLRLVHASVAHGFVLARVGLKLTPHPAPPAQLHRSRLQRQP